MNIKILFVLLFINISPVAVNHPLNLSVTHLSYKNNHLHMKIKLFIDDFQASLSQFSKLPIDLINVPVRVNENIIRKYISAHVKTSIDGIPVKWNYKTTSLYADVIFIEYDSYNTTLPGSKSIKVKNYLLFDDIPEQKNIMNINLSGTEKVLIFYNGVDKRIEKEIKLK